jgi:hypothetical protein
VEVRPLTFEAVWGGDEGGGAGVRGVGGQAACRGQTVVGEQSRAGRTSMRASDTWIIYTYKLGQPY